MFKRLFPVLLIGVALLAACVPAEPPPAPTPVADASADHRAGRGNQRACDPGGSIEHVAAAQTRFQPV